MKLKLGKKAPVHDPRTLRLSKYVGAVPEPPATILWGDTIVDWKMFKNDQVGDCAIADPAHAVMAWTEEARGKAVEITDAQVIKAYSDVSGYDPRTGRNDNGCVMLDVMRYWRKTGIAGYKINAFAEVQPHEHLGVKHAVWLFGGFSLGLDLPETADTQFNAGKPWVVTSRTGAGKKGSWGGHAVRVVGYDDKWVYVVTWGKLQKMSWMFLSEYGDEGWCPISIDWFDNTGQAPNGFAWARLAADLKAIADAPLEYPVGPGPKPPEPPKPPTPPATSEPVSCIITFGGHQLTFDRGLLVGVALAKSLDPADGEEE